MDFDLVASWRQSRDQKLSIRVAYGCPDLPGLLMGDADPGLDQCRSLSVDDLPAQSSLGELRERGTRQGQKQGQGAERCRGADLP